MTVRLIKRADFLLQAKEKRKSLKFLLQIMYLMLELVTNVTPLLRLL